MVFVRGPKEKKSRAVGENLGLKAFRSNSPKSSLIRKPYRPGVHGKSRRKRILSEYGLQLLEKQKVRLTYGLREKEMKKMVQEAIASMALEAPEALLRNLEMRLDNVVFRVGFAPARSIARQMVSHGHIMVNNRKVTISSQRVKIGDRIFIRPQSRDKKIFIDLQTFLKKHKTPSWIKFDNEKLEAEIIGYPNMEEAQLNFNLPLVIEFYSR